MTGTTELRAAITGLIELAATEEEMLLASAPAARTAARIAGPPPPRRARRSPCTKCVVMTCWRECGATRSLRERVRARQSVTG
jgi:hypothetical protein